MKRSLVMVSALALCALPAMAGEWHTGTNNLCTDCHTMHFSQTHNWDGSTPVSTTPQPDGNWIGPVASGPNHYLLKLPANELCLTCHDGQTFSPDVYGTNANASPTEGRMAGALNGDVGALTPGAGYDHYRGHTLESTARPPGYNPSVVSATADPYPVGSQLECLNCHLNHGIASSYRNLGPRSWGVSGSLIRPSYVIDTTNDASMDVWINIASHTPNTGSAATFNPYYDYANIFYNRNDTTLTTGYQNSNTLDTFCASCHGDFHGGPADVSVGGVPHTNPGAFEEFIRHPTSAMTIGLIGGGHSGLPRYVAAAGNNAAVKVYTTDYVAYTDASPGCVSCHKAHGNQNPFGLFFLDPNATSIDDEGGAHPTLPQMANGYGTSFMGLCGQCHTQGINFGE